MEKVFTGRTLKSSVVVNENDYAELKYPESNWEEDELAIMNAWQVEAKRARKKALDDFSDPMGDDFGGDPGADFGDDDIPF